MVVHASFSHLQLLSVDFDLKISIKINVRKLVIFIECSYVSWCIKKLKLINFVDVQTFEIQKCSNVEITFLRRLNCNRKSNS